MLLALGLAAALAQAVIATTLAQSTQECWMKAGDNEGRFFVLRLRDAEGEVAVDVDGLCQALSDSAGTPWVLFTADIPRLADGSAIDPASAGLDLACNGISHGATYSIWNTRDSAVFAARTMCSDPWAGG